MTASSTFWLNCEALTLLILVNAVTTDVSLAMEDEAAKSNADKDAAPRISPETPMEDPRVASQPPAPTPTEEAATVLVKSSARKKIAVQNGPSA